MDAIGMANLELAHALKKHPIYPESFNYFFSKLNETKVTFTETGLIFHQGDQAISAKRIK